jgi:osmotically-inducible protein OsmY
MVMVLATHTDADVQSEVLDELAYDPQVAPNEVGVQVRAGIVTLLGDVDSNLKRLAAAAAAHRVRGVTAVANELVVRLPQAYDGSDEMIAQAAVQALRSSTSIPDEALDVTVCQGMVTLSGAVAWDHQRRAAARAVHDLAGVRGVVNAIAIHHRAKPAEVRARIEAALVRSATVDARHVRVEEQDGAITLTGSVRTLAERRDAEQAAWFAPGVTAVDNRIAIRP